MLFWDFHCFFGFDCYVFAMFDDGQKVDLYKLLIVVDMEGGFDAVCELWDLVREECGLGDEYDG